MANQPIISIAYHSGYGHTAKVAEAVKRGAEGAGALVHLINVEDIDTPINEHEDGWAALAASHAIIFGAPTYMGGPSAPFKVFQDKTSKVWFTQGWKDKLAGGFTNSGSFAGDKLATLQQFSVLAAQQSMVWVSLGLMPGFNSTKGSPQDLNRTGHYLGVATQANVDEGADVAPPESDLKTAEHYGARMAEAAKRWNGLG